MPALNPQARDAPEMSNVPCHQCQAMRQGGGSNQNIGIADELPFTMKIGVDVSRPDDDFIC
jgi:hypothetical protein